ncbi:hypothetical protein VNI00_010379 [Paramarasmius palmivorus]|uniref:Uncharacterized protein n=1 Tax=Paramarasmius palmivorus TaxID=297713 RepID=A0AAW0CJG7_9AGAR
MPPTYHSISHPSKEVAPDQDIDPERLTAVRRLEPKSFRPKFMHHNAGTVLSEFYIDLQKQDETSFTYISCILLAASIILHKSTELLLPELIRHIFIAPEALAICGLIADFLISLHLGPLKGNGRRATDNEETHSSCTGALHFMLGGVIPDRFGGRPGRCVVSETSGVVYFFDGLG